MAEAVNFYFDKNIRFSPKEKRCKVGTELVFIPEESGLVTLSARQEVTRFILLLVQFNLLFV